MTKPDFGPFGILKKDKNKTVVHKCVDPKETALIYSKYIGCVLNKNYIITVNKRSVTVKVEGLAPIRFINC